MTTAGVLERDDEMSPSAGEPTSQSEASPPPSPDPAALDDAPPVTSATIGADPAVIESVCPEHILVRRGRNIKVRVMEVGGGHALVFGNIADNCLVRIHSRCLYGDALQSDDCDCGPELDLSLDMIQAEGTGVLIYLEQEGRGAGLMTKARAYEIGQARRLDSFASYIQLGYEPDYRSYETAAATLKSLGLRAVRLLTNNPDKVRDLVDAGLRVRRVSLHILPRNRSVHRYLQAKREIRGHRLPRRWWLHRMVRGLSIGLGAVTFSAVCAVAIGAVSHAAVQAGVVATAGGAVTVDRMVTVLAGLAAGGWGWQRTNLVRARLRLLRSRVSESRIATDDKGVTADAPSTRP